MTVDTITDAVDRIETLSQLLVSYASDLYAEDKVLSNTAYFLIRDAETIRAFCESAILELCKNKLDE